MAFVFGGVQKDLPCKHIFYNSKVLLRVCRILQHVGLCNHLLYPSVVTYLPLLRFTYMFSLVMRIYRPQFIGGMWRESPSLCTSFFGGGDWEERHNA